MTLQEKLERRLNREVDRKRNQNASLIYKKYLDLVRKADKRENQNVSL